MLLNTHSQIARSSLVAWIKLHVPVPYALHCRAESEAHGQIPRISSHGHTTLRTCPRTLSGLPIMMAREETTLQRLKIVTSPSLVLTKNCSRKSQKLGYLPFRYTITPPIPSATMTNANVRVLTSIVAPFLCSSELVLCGLLRSIN